MAATATTNDDHGGRTRATAATKVSNRTKARSATVASRCRNEAARAFECIAWTTKMNVPEGMGATAAPMRAASTATTTKESRRIDTTSSERENARL